MPPTYLIVDNSQVGDYDQDYVDYLLEIEYNSVPSTLIDIPEGDGRGSEWDDANLDVPAGVNLGHHAV